MGNQIRLIAIALLVAACSSSGSTAKKADAAVDAFSSTCGQPGDMGNEIGVGKFCPDLQDAMCPSTAPLCSILGDSTTHFCTKTCTNGGSADQCGTNATCSCNSQNQCGCVPNSCL
jgi:hypothetical protein